MNFKRWQKLLKPVSKSRKIFLHLKMQQQNLLLKPNQRTHPSKQSNLKMLKPLPKVR